MTPESIACIKEIKNYAFNQCKIYNQPWNADTKITGVNAFMNTMWYCPVELPANDEGPLPSSLFQNAYFGGEFTWPTSNNNSIQSSAFYNVQFEKNTTFIIPASIKKLYSSCCYGMAGYDPVGKKNINLERIEVLSKDELLFDSTSQFYTAKYDHLIFHAVNIGSMSNTALSQSSTSNPNGNVVFLNMSSLPTIASNTFNATSLSKGNAYVYVPDDLVDEAKTKTNWSNISARIKPLSEWPLYSEYAEHILPREDV